MIHDDGIYGVVSLFSLLFPFRLFYFIENSVKVVSSVISRPKHIVPDLYVRVMLCIP